jgi:hypothetical protein
MALVGATDHGRSAALDAACIGLRVGNVNNNGTAECECMQRCQSAAVRVIVSQIAGVEQDNGAIDIKKETPITEPETKGAFAMRHIGKFLDIVLAPAIVGISPQDGEGLVVEIGKAGMLSGVRSGEAVKLLGCAHGK